MKKNNTSLGTILFSYKFLAFSFIFSASFITIYPYPSYGSSSSVSFY